MHRTSLLGLLASSTAAAASMPSEEVPLLGPSFLANFDPTDSQYMLNATETFPGVIDALFESGALNETDLVFAVDVFSAATNKSVYSYFHASDDSKRALTSGELNDETIGRTGSVSKLFTAYAILVAAAGIEVFSHPVTRYLPELLGNSSGDPLDHVRWEDVTVGALAAHQAGSGGLGTFLDRPDDEFLKVSPEELFEYMRDSRRPVISPYRNAVYSDGGYALLGQVLARLTGKTYGDALRDTILEPLGLNGTSIAAPEGPDINAIDRTNVTSTISLFGVDNPIAASTGGVYSNAADLRALGLSILNSELLSAANTSHWMKPLSGTGSLVELVGAPWEIQRLAVPATPGSNRTRISDLYTKAGGNWDYTCILALSPDHGVGYSILVAGETAGTARWPIRDAVGELFIPAAEAAAAENAARNLAGTFAAAAASSEGSNITLTVDDGHPGLGIESFFVEGVDRLAQLTAEPVSLRLYPTGLYSNSRSLSALYSTEGSFRTSYRLVVAPPAPRASSEGGTGGLFDNQRSWMDIGFFDASDDFVMSIEDGKLREVRATVGDAQVTFERVE